MAISSKLHARIRYRWIVVPVHWLYVLSPAAQSLHIGSQGLAITAHHLFPRLCGLSVTEASYVVQPGTVVQVVANIAAGATISYTGRYKPISLFFALPLIVFDTGLLIHFRQPGHYVGYITMCSIFNNFGCGILMLTNEIGILAAVRYQYCFDKSLLLHW
ncbi:hypothetical protein WAI453_013708 [Rhynchosporium graminicola]